MAKIGLFSLLACCIGFFATAQTSTIGFADNFDDGNYTNAPIWTASTPNQLTINALKELQLNAPAAGTAEIVTSYNTTTDMVWEFYVRMEFAPSASNRAVINLESDGASPSAEYSLLIGEDGADDRIRLVRTMQHINTPIPILNANSLIIRDNKINARVRIKRTQDRVWSIEADYNGGFAFVPDGQIKETANIITAPTQNEFYIWLNFSETRKDKFFFDDFKVYQNTADVVAPKAILAKAINNNTVEVTFDEVIDSLTAKNTNNYNINNNIGQPQSVIYQFNKVQLQLAKNLTAGTTYALIINDIKDIVGNNSSSITLNFETAIVPVGVSKYDVIINEIFADPTPQVALPKTEFVELYNRSNTPINLGAWSIKDGSKTLYTLPKYTLLPQKYLIIYKRDVKIDFGKYGDTLALSSFFALNTQGDEITLFDEKKNVIDYVRYDLSTYRNVAKSDGGYTLERINPTVPCLGMENWRASDSDNGGTPGKQNSIYNTTKDNTAPSLVYVFPNSATELILRFSRSVDLTSLSTITFDNNLKIKEIKEALAANEAIVVLDAALQKGKIYTMTIPATLKDCVGNAANISTVQLALPESADSKDLVINEVLFNPKTNAADFIELYNRSNKAINLAGLYIDNKLSISTQKEIINNYLLLPQRYVVITDNIENIKNNYKVENPNEMIEMTLPTLADDEGNVTIYRADAPGKKVIDELSYTEDWHYLLLNDKSGVSLERLNPERATQDSSNWYSAASVAGFATPTYRNSQYKELTQNAKNQIFTLDAARVSPDNDGFEDFVNINYTSNDALTATLRIYDLNGAPIKTLVQNQTLATEGTLRWDGDNDNGGRATMGIYVLLIEYFTPDGKVGREKETITVVYQL